jgi:hypothetical protein
MGISNIRMIKRRNQKEDKKATRIQTEKRVRITKPTDTNEYLQKPAGNAVVL